jgi:hypothetical protein
MRFNHRIRDLTGFRVGRLLVIALSHLTPDLRHAAMWRCLCDCGNTTIVSASNLTRKFKPGSQPVQSCGCYLTDSVTRRNKARGFRLASVSSSVP